MIVSATLWDELVAPPERTGVGGGIRDWRMRCVEWVGGDVNSANRLIPRTCWEGFGGDSHILCVQCDVVDGAGRVGNRRDIWRTGWAKIELYGTLKKRCSERFGPFRPVVLMISVVFLVYVLC